MAFLAGAAEALGGSAVGEAAAGAGATDFIGGASDALKTANTLLSGGLRLYNTISSITSMKSESDVKDDYLKRLYNIGLLNLGSPEENRRKRGEYVASRLISPDYSEEAIVETLKKGRLPTGWSEDNAVSQGFVFELILSKRNENINTEMKRKEIFDSDAYNVRKIANWFNNDIENRNNDELIKMMKIH